MAAFRTKTLERTALLKAPDTPTRASRLAAGEACGETSQYQIDFDGAMPVQEIGAFTLSMLTNTFHRESPNGEWSSDVFDGDTNNVGQLFSWRLRIYYGDQP